MGLHQIDTRKLTRNLRETGAKKGIISTEDHDYESLLKKVRDFPDIEGLDLVKEVTCSEPYDWDDRPGDGIPRRTGPSRNSGSLEAYDFGIKQNILRLLVDGGKSASLPGNDNCLKNSWLPSLMESFCPTAPATPRPSRMRSGRPKTHW